MAQEREAPAAGGARRREPHKYITIVRDESESLDQSPTMPPTRFVYANAGEPSTNQPTD